MTPMSLFGKLPRVKIRQNPSISTAWICSGRMGLFYTVSYGKGTIYRESAGPFTSVPMGNFIPYPKIHLSRSVAIAWRL